MRSGRGDGLTAEVKKVLYNADNEERYTERETRYSKNTNESKSRLCTIKHRDERDNAFRYPIGYTLEYVENCIKYTHFLFSFLPSLE